MSLPALLSAQVAPPPNPLAAGRRPATTTNSPDDIWASAGATIINRTTRCGSVILAGASVAMVNTALSNCPAGQYVELGPGNFTFGSSINLRNNVTLRGAGPNSTFISVTGGGCPYGGAVCFNPNTGNFMNSPENASNWTAGYARGTATITLASASALSVGSVILLDETNDSTPDKYPGLWYCMVETTCVVSSGAGGGDSGATRTGRIHSQIAMVTAKNGNQVTINPPLLTDYSSGKSPQATWPNSTTTGAGIEEVAITGNNSMNDILEFGNTVNSWAKHVRLTAAQRSNVLFQYSAFNTVRDSYLFKTERQDATSYGMEWQSGAAMLIENNIFQYITAPVMVQSGSANVIAYNVTVNQPFTPSQSTMFAGMWNHAGGADFNLFEGNETAGHNHDDEHGPSFMTTIFRSYLPGREGTKTDATNSIAIAPLNRFYNILGNVLGTSGYHTSYQCVPSSCPSGDLSVFYLGNATGSGPGNDVTVAASMFRWGNWDVVTSTADNTSGDQTGTRWNSVEVPSGIGGSFANPLPSSQTLPASMYRSAKPSFMKSSDPWPFYGPDVTHASPISNTGGHAAHNPAAQCYYNVMGGTSTGTTLLPFTCTYGSAPGAPSAPTNLRIVS